MPFLQPQSADILADARYNPLLAAADSLPGSDYNCTVSILLAVVLGLRAEVQEAAAGAVAALAMLGVEEAIEYAMVALRSHLENLGTAWPVEILAIAEVAGIQVI